MMMPRSAIMWGVVGAVALVAIAASGLLFLQEPCRDFSEATLQVGSRELSVALAQNDVERTRGLSGCEGLPRESGMYFPYDTPRSVAYWMKGMLIPLDIIWVADGKVVGIEVNVPPADKFADDPPQYRSPVPVSGVLEVAAGQAEALGITQGSTVTLLP